IFSREWSSDVCSSDLVDTESDGIALVTWDMPDRSMNVFTEEVMDELEKIVDRVAGDDTIKGAVITSGKESFSAGADLTMLQKMLDRKSVVEGTTGNRV